MQNDDIDKILNMKGWPKGEPVKRKKSVSFFTILLIVLMSSTYITVVTKGVAQHVKGSCK